MLWLYIIRYVYAYVSYCKTSHLRSNGKRNLLVLNNVILQLENLKAFMPATYKWALCQPRMPKGYGSCLSAMYILLNFEL